MAYALNGDVRLYWRESGSGAPLLLIMGLGYSSGMWHHVEAGLARHFRVIVFDNRGIGKSEAPDGIHAIPQMAEDARAVLDAAGVDSAFVFGLSMGGFIAQELALLYPGRVRALVLGATTCGGQHAVRASQQVQDLLVNRSSMPIEESIRVMMPFIYDARTPAARLDADFAVRLAEYPRPEVYFGQLAGIRLWQGCERLHRIQAPTLVLHGEHDELVPPENALLLKRHIVNAQMQLIRDASHVFTTDAPEETVRLISDFLRQHLA